MNKKKFIKSHDNTHIKVYKMKSIHRRAREGIISITDKQNIFHVKWMTKDKYAQNYFMIYKNEKDKAKAEMVSRGFEKKIYS